jgi:hypothetical protein
MPMRSHEGDPRVGPRSHLLSQGRNRRPVPKTERAVESKDRLPPHYAQRRDATRTWRDGPPRRSWRLCRTLDLPWEGTSRGSVPKIHRL